MGAFAVAGGENEADAAVLQRLGETVALFPAHVHVEYRAIEGAASQVIFRFVERRGEGNLRAFVHQHVLETESDDRFVFQYQKPGTVEFHSFVSRRQCRPSSW